MDVLLENKVAVGLCIVIGLVLVGLLGKTMRKQMKKGLILFLIIAGLGTGYYYLTGKSPAEIPAAIDYYFNGPQAPTESTHKYYRDPDKDLKELKN
ncbi:MAG: hypothetical protein U9R57_01810 [Thermodesulfobacteriota bacterium]|nr:hypothetical protein [Thermodesulfobacteriota bacterium]